MKLTFYGAAGEVTGSQHLIETDRVRLLLDCGLFQGHRAETYAKNRRFHCNPAALDGVLLSHAHIDHCGNLPGLYRAGYRGPIFCSRATADVAAVMLQDSLHIQEEDARSRSEPNAADAPPLEPLYTPQDVRGVLEQFEPLELSEWHELSPTMRVRLTEAGHILGSVVTTIDLEERGDVRRIVFTGDLGRRGLPLLREPEPVGGCDVLITESTYGNAIHPPAVELQERVLAIVRRAAQTGGKVIIPAFSLGRTQHVVYFLRELWQRGHLPAVPLFVDSPLASRITEVYRRHEELLNASALGQMRQGRLFEFPLLTYLDSPKESMELNWRDGPFVVVSASGMCENGRVRHHLAHSVEDERNTIAMIGFQAEGTLGRQIAGRRPTVKILDRVFQLRARVEVLNGLSAHADADDFKWFFTQMSRESHIGRAFLVHGEQPALQSLASILYDLCDEDPTIPAWGESFEV